MFKRIMTIIILSGLLSAPAHAAWFLNTWVRSGGGTIVVRGGIPQTSANGSVYKSYTTSQPFTVTVNPNAGYRISQVNYNGVVTSNPSQTSYTVQGPNSQNVFAWFAAQPLTVTASTGDGGSVTPNSLSGIYYGTKLYSARSFAFIPSPATYRVVGISGVPAGATVSPALPVAAGTTVSVTLPVGFTFTSNIALYGTFSGPPVAKTGPPQVVMAGSPTTLDGSSSTGTIGSYSWTQTSGPGFPASKVIADNTPGAQTTFTPTVLGTYTFRLTVTGGSTASTTVTVTNSIVDAVRAQCQNCHVENEIGTAANVFGKWSTSRHKETGVICSRCHVGADAGGHPGPLRSGSVSESTFNYIAPFGTGNFCITCHNPAIVTDFAASVHVAPAGTNSCSYCHVGGVHNPNAACVDCHTPGNSLGLPWPPPGASFHNAYTGTDLCVNCHNLHNPSIVTGAAYPHFTNYSSAQYATTNILCNNCHNNSEGVFSVYSANRQWAKTGKANPKSPAYIGPGPYTEANLEAFDFKFLGTPLPAKPATTTSQDCVRCHTTTGFIAYITPTVPENPDTAFSNIEAWGTPGDRTREMVACNACHNNTTGFDAAFSRRSVGIETDPVFNPGVYSVAAWYGYSSAATKKIIRPKSYANPAGEAMFDSNLCITCHTGKTAGDLIKLSSNCNSKPSIACRVGATGSFWTNVDFIDPHNMNTANLMFPDGLSAGYDYRAATAIAPYHTNIGLENSQGPCVGCHMTSPNKHSFNTLSSASNGVISAIRTPVCSTCHGVISMPIDASTLQADKAGYEASLAVLIAQLAAKGLHYNAALSPYFFTTADPGQQTFANRTLNWDINPPTFKGADVMGAAFNLRLLQPGAGWVHNATYSKRLLYDTIDYLDDGVQNGSASTTIGNMSLVAYGYLVPRL